MLRTGVSTPSDFAPERLSSRTMGADFSGPRPDTAATGVRSRGLDIKAGAAKLKADRAALVEAELVVDRWNRRLATGRDMLWSPTIRTALIAGTPRRQAQGRPSPTFPTGALILEFCWRKLNLFKGR
jgi:hypothetical protein